MKTIILTGLVYLIINSSFAQNNAWNISTQDKDPYTGIVVANGRIGILPSSEPFGVEHIILNNVYDKASPTGVSRILQGMNFGNLLLEVNGERIHSDNIKDWQQTLNMKEAKLNCRFKYKNLVELSYDIYALRQTPYCGYIDISIKALSDVDLKVSGFIESPQNLKATAHTFKTLKDLDTTIPLIQSRAQSSYGRHSLSTSACFVWHQINSSRAEERPSLEHQILSEHKQSLSFKQSLSKGKSLDFAWLAAQCSSQDFSDPISESERFVVYNMLRPKTQLLDVHKKQWSELWQGDIIIEGDLQSQQDVRLALYHLYAFSRAGSYLSIAPMGLSSQGYNGHIFWDTELWMYPPLLLLNQDIALSLLNYRSDRLEAAKMKAANYGFEGAMFPWESDDTGEEATPTWALTGTFEHHVTADVAIAFWNYYLLTKDRAWLKEKGYPMLKAIADFWVSRATKNSDGTYSIKNVVGANEFAHNVDDNAFTNGAAITALQNANAAAQVLGLEAHSDWKHLANNLKIYAFKDGTTKEHSQYQGEIIKQADVNLLAYPLRIIQDKDQILKDLKYYEPKLAPEGPAMGKAIFAILYARMGHTDKAFQLFKDSYKPNKRPPFGALSESALSNNPYFATGAGGLLQVVLFGFGGLHLEEEGLVQKNAVLPKAWKSLTIKGIGPNKSSFTVTAE